MRMAAFVMKFFFFLLRSENFLIARAGDAMIGQSKILPLFLPFDWVPVAYLGGPTQAISDPSGGCSFKAPFCPEIPGNK